MRQAENKTHPSMFARLAKKITCKHVMNSGVACACDMIKSHVTNAQIFCLSLIKAGGKSKQNHKQNLDMENVQFAVLQIAISSLQALLFKTFPGAGSTRTDA